MSRFKNNLHVRANKFALIIAAIIFAALANPASLAAQTSTGPLDAQEESKISKMLAASGVPSISIAIRVRRHSVYRYAAAGSPSTEPKFP